MGFFVLFVLIAIGITVFKVSMARDAARRAGLDPDEATAITLLGESGLEATYLSANLRQQQPAEPADEPTTAERLTELDELRSRGLVTEQEYAAKRADILEDL